MTNTMQVANTIRNQIGNQALAMLGAKDLVAGSDHLQFGIQGCKKINKIVIRLAADDTYTVQFWKYNRKTFDCVMVKEVEGVYVDSMHKVIESETGLYTRL